MILIALLRALLLLTLIFGAHGLNLLSRALVRPFSKQKHRLLRDAAFRFWARWSCRIFGVRLEVSGKPPTGAFFLVSNHVSYLDIMVLGSEAGGAFIGKADLKGWPVLGWMFEAADSIFIDRSRKMDLLRVMQRVDEMRRDGYGIVLFPEGTSGRGDCLLRFKPPLLQYPAERDLPVHYATLSYRSPKGYPTAQEAICWWGDAPFAPHFWRLLHLPWLETTLQFGESPVHHPDRKRLASDLHEAMSEQFLPMD